MAEYGRIRLTRESKSFDWNMPKRAGGRYLCPCGVYGALGIDWAELEQKYEYRMDLIAHDRPAKGRVPVCISHRHNSYLFRGCTFNANYYAVVFLKEFDAWGIEPKAGTYFWLEVK